jgi:hypothetical protein
VSRKHVRICKLLFRQISPGGGAKKTMKNISLESGNPPKYKPRTLPLQLVDCRCRCVVMA